MTKNIELSEFSPLQVHLFTPYMVLSYHVSAHFNHRLQIDHWLIRHFIVQSRFLVPFINQMKTTSNKTETRITVISPPLPSPPKSDPAVVSAA